MEADQTSSFAEPLAGLAVALGQPLLLDSSGQCALLFDGDIEIVLAVAGELITLRSTLLRGTPDRCDMALAANYGELPPGLCIALDKASSLLVLFSSAAEGGLTADDLVGRVARFVALVPLLRTRLAGEGETPAPHAPLNVGIRG